MIQFQKKLINFDKKTLQNEFSATLYDPCNQYSNNCSQCLQNGCGFCLTSPQFSNYSVCSNKSNDVITKTCIIPQLLNGDWITSGSTCPSNFFPNDFESILFFCLWLFSNHLNY